jgi:Cu-Zn family superoxide dismutase
MVAVRRRHRCDRVPGDPRRHTARLASRRSPFDPLPSKYELPGETVFPEGVATLPGPDYFSVSSTDDGAIFRGQLHDPEADVFLPGGQGGRTAATGLAVDAERHVLFVSGAATEMVWAYDLRTRELVGSGANDYEQTFINDVTVTPDGSAYFTDSMQPVIYRLSGAGSGPATFEEWLDLTGTAIEHQEGFNLNGIVATQDGAYLLVFQTNTGKLFRVSTGEEADAVQRARGHPCAAVQRVERAGLGADVVQPSVAQAARLITARGARRPAPR